MYVTDHCPHSAGSYIISHFTEVFIMSEEIISANANADEANNTELAAPAAVPEPEPIPSMDEFKEEIAHSFRKLNPGDIVTGTVIGVSDTEVTVDLNSYAEGIIRLEDLSNDPRFSIKADIKPGDTVSATVLRENKEGAFLLSLKEADDILAWDKLEAAKAEEKVETVKVAEAVKAGVTTFLYGVRAFIPASQLALNYVEDLDSYVGRTLEVTILDVNRESKKLVLSAKEVLRKKAAEDKAGRIGRLQTGIITTGKVEKLMPFGAFVNIGEDLTGLVHISQICGKRIKHPGAVLTEGQEVTVKIMDVKDGKISLSMTAVDEKNEDEILDDAVDDAAESYADEGSVSTGLGDLLKNFKF